jgi:hypothetical protein
MTNSPSNEITPPLELIESAEDCNTVAEKAAQTNKAAILPDARMIFDISILPV